MQRFTSFLVRLPIVALLALAPMVGTGCGDDTVPTDLKSITVAPTAATIGVGATQKFVATGLYSNGTTKVLTDSEVTWTSGDTSVATMSGSTATGVKAGTTKIAAKSANVTGQADLTVKEKKLISVAITPPSATIAMTTTQQFTATANYDDGTNGDVTQSTDVKWTTSDATIATVDAKGLATGVKNGTVDITVEFQSMKDSARLTVGAKPKSIAVTPATQTLPVGGKQQYTATATLEDNTQQDITSQVTWTSSSTATATINATGEATAVAIGNSTITATLGTVSGTATLTVTAKVVTKVEVTPNPVPSAITVGGKQKFIATAIFNDNSTQDVTATATWASSDATIATIDATGEATGVKNGATLISATYLTIKSNSVSLTVGGGGVVVTSIAVTPATKDLAVGLTQQYTAMATMSDATQVNITSAAAWQSSTIATASINAAGLATAKAVGTTTITATYQGVNGTATLNVTTKVVTALAVTPSSAQSIPNGGTITFTCTATFTDNTTQDVSTQATWAAAPATFLSFTANVAKGIAVGSTKVSCALPSAQGITSNLVDVVVGPQILVSIAIDNPPTSAIPVGATYALTATGTYSDGSKQPVTATAVWTSGTPATATISNAVGSHGVATAVASGTTAITAAIGTIVSPAVTLTVATGVTLSFITITPDTATVNVGQAQLYKAVGTYSDGSTFDITNTATWTAVCHTGTSIVGNVTIDKGNVVGVSSTFQTNCGVAGGPVADFVRVRAQFGAIQSFAKVTVKNTTISKIVVNCTHPTDPLTCLPVGIGYQRKCIATATFADGSSGAVTTTASWGSTVTTVATAAANGVATIVGAGTTVITATQGGQTSATTGVDAANATLQGIAATLTSIANPGNATIYKGQDNQFSATGTFSTSAAGCPTTFTRSITEHVTWNSANGTVASVSNAAGTRGLATGLAGGTSQITAALGTVTSPAGTLTVNPACLQKVAFDQKNPTYPGQVTVQFSVKGYFSDAPTTPVQLKPSDFTGTPLSGVAGCGGYAIDSGTWVLKVGSGTCNGITFSTTQGICGTTAVSDTTNITVDTAAVLNTLTIAPATASIVRGAAQDFVATATYASYGSFNVSAWGLWSNNPAVTGLLAPVPQPVPPAVATAERFQHTGLTGGTTVVSVAYGSKTATANLEITGKTITTVTLAVAPGECASGGYPVGLKLTLTGTVTYSDGSQDTNPTGMTFTPSDPAKLSVAGNIATTLAPSAGTDPTLIASFQGTASTPAKAIPIRANTGTGAVTLTEMTFSEAQGATLPLNTTKPLTIQGVYANCGTGGGTGNFDISALVVSASSNSSIVDVATSTTGTLIMTKATPTGGTPVTLSFIKDGLTRNLGINVAATACITGVTIAPASVNLPRGLTQDFTATATWSNGAPATDVTTNGSWSPDNAYLDNQGLVVGKARYRAFTNSPIGASTVTFTLNSGTGAGTVCKGGDPGQLTVTGNATVNVTAGVINGVVIFNDLGDTFDRWIPLGEHAQYKAYGIMSDGSPLVDVTTAAGTVWTSLAPGIVTISTTGWATAVAAGTASPALKVTITGGFTDDIGINVADCGGPTIGLSPSTTPTALPIGQTRDFSAIATFYTNTCVDNGDCTGGRVCGFFTGTCVVASCQAFFTQELTTDVTTIATWNSTVPAAATVNNQGRVAGVAVGTTNLTAAYRSSTSPVIVVNVVSATLKRLTVTQPSGTVFLGAGGAMEVNVDAVWGDATCICNPGVACTGTCFNLDPPLVTWQIGDNTLISIAGPKTGSANHTYTVTGLKAPGSTPYFAQVGIVVSNTNNVTVADACVTGITINSPSADVTWPVGVPFTVGYTCTTSNGSNLPCVPTFSVTNDPNNVIESYSGANYTTTGKARVNLGATAGQSGEVVATVAGCAGPVSHKRKITVGAATLASISLPATIGFPKGFTKLIPATGVYTTGTGAGSYDISDVAIYNSSNVNVLTAPAIGGMLTSKQLDGTSIVTATYQSKTSNNCTAVVSGKQLLSVAITAELNCSSSGIPGTNACPGGVNASYPAGGFQLQLTATGTYSDTSTANLSDQVTWSLGTPLVAGTAISATGLLTTGNPTAAADQVINANMAPAPQASFTVRIIPGAVSTIAIKKSNAVAPFFTDLDTTGEKVAKGNTQPYISMVQILGGYTFFATRNVTWASSVTTVGTIVATGAKAGEFHAAELGVTNISANKGAVSSGPVAVTVTGAVAVSMYCKPATVNLVVGGTGQLRGWVKLSDGTENEVTTDPNWQWQVTGAAATVGANTGLATGAAAGTSTAYPQRIVGGALPVPAVVDRCSIVVQ